MDIRPICRANFVPIFHLVLLSAMQSHYAILKVHILNSIFTFRQLPGRNIARDMAIFVQKNVAMLRAYLQRAVNRQPGYRAGGM